ncbi:MAG TPA: hypothetical protein ENH06_01865 [bacterium]|nr:hypothetical protein [bacterium]
MEFAIVGNGRMGKMVKQELEKLELEKLDPEHICIEIIDKDDWKESSLKRVDTAIVFVSIEVGYEVVKRILKKGVDAIVGTTSFYLNPDKSENKGMLQELELLAKDNNCRLVISPNFAPGVNAFWEIVRFSARILSKMNYDSAIEERHHKRKADISGTAKEIGKILLEEYKYKTCLDLGSSEGKREDNAITIRATRAGNITGEHTTLFASELDTIEIIHRASSPAIFAQGAIRSAILVRRKKPGFYRMKDLYPLSV